MNSIEEKRQKSKAFAIVSLILVVIAGLGLVRFKQIHDLKPPISIIGQSQASNTLLYIAAQGGSVYYLPWCAGAFKIHEAHKLIFTSQADAEKAGFRPAAGCFH